jgi:hypothetical protein
MEEIGSRAAIFDGEGFCRQGVGEKTCIVRSS